MHVPGLWWLQAMRLPGIRWLQAIAVGLPSHHSPLRERLGSAHSCYASIRGLQCLFWGDATCQLWAAAGHLLPPLSAGSLAQGLLTSSSIHIGSPMLH